jgi:arsenate reductase
MAEGLLRSISGEAFDVQSAGTNPSTVLPKAIKAMAEIGIDISKHRSNSVDEFAGANIDYVLTVCDNAREACPYFPATTLMVHHSFEDPAEVEGGEEALLAAFRSVRDQIRDYLQNDFVKVINTT